MCTTTIPEEFARTRSVPIAFGSKSSMPQELLRKRAEQLLQEEIDFIPNRSFLDVRAETEVAAGDEAAFSDRGKDSRAPRDLPNHLARMCETKLLTAEEETRFFRRMNYLKFKANALRSRLDPENPDAAAIAEIERCLGQAQAVRDRIVQANMRLVMSVVKKFVTPQLSFDDLLSDGTYSLMQAVEKFDFDRGFRFSTYAYRAIARNAYRAITDGQKESARFATSPDESNIDFADHRGSSQVSDESWDRLRNLLAQLLHRLDRRERFIIRSRYALGAHRRVRTFQCLANKLGLSKERVRQLEQRAVAKLRDFAAEQRADEIVGPAFR